MSSNMNPYLRTKILTASPAELRLMLYDGAIKFCRQAVHAMAQKDREGMYNALIRAQKIVLELSTSLNHKENPELCSRMEALYTYIYRRLVDANMEHDESPIHESISLLEYERETWMMVMKKAQDEGVSGAEQGAASLAAKPNPAPPAAAPAAYANATSEAPTNPIAQIGPQSPAAAAYNQPRSNVLSIQG